MFIALAGCAAASATVVGTTELLLLTAAGLMPARPLEPASRPLRKLAVVVPAHNEEGGIARCVRSLLAVARPSCEYEVVVVADNCSDATAARAREAGARVLERQNLELRGKGYALEYAFNTLLEDKTIDAILVVDADTEVEPNFAVACEQAFAAGADAVQTRYLVRNPGESQRTRLMNVALMAFNVLRPRGREWLGLSVGIGGNGWGMSRACLEQVPYAARSVVEDLEHHIHLVRAGKRVRFIDGTTVRADMPTGGAGADTQRARWEGGRFRMIREHVPGLLREALTGKPRLLEPACELMLLPLAYHVGALGGTLVIPFLPTQLYALSGLSIVGAHVLAGLAVGGADKEDLQALLSVPRYIAWKVGLATKILDAAAKEQAWVRTAREEPKAASELSER
jgi:cellulose synthase/poly-beta-1,6-N-acetylglucosamine synthase-like glycosyltransferase